MIYEKKFGLLRHAFPCGNPQVQIIVLEISPLTIERITSYVDRK